MTEFRPRRFEVIPLVIKNLLIINVLVFLAQLTISKHSSFSIEDHFALHDIHSVYFQPYQLLTYMFLHGGWDHLFFNMFALWMFGSLLENIWGAKRFLIFYIICGLGAAALHLGILYYEMEPAMQLFKTLPPAQQASLLYDPNFVVNVPTLGASGAIFGCLAASGYLFPNSMVYIYFFVPMKMKWFVLLYAAIELFLAIRNSAGDNIGHFAHLGGALTGFIIVFIWNKMNRKTFY